MFEHSSAPLLSRPKFFRRLRRYGAVALLLVTGSLMIGILGYRLFEGMSWIDATLNAAMILGGMGPVNPLRTDAGKLFASFYALFAGIIFLVSVGVFIAPIFHRLLHQFHVDPDDDSDDDDDNENSADHLPN